MRGPKLTSAMLVWEITVSRSRFLLKRDRFFDQRSIDRNQSGHKCPLRCALPIWYSWIRTLLRNWLGRSGDKGKILDIWTFFSLLIQSNARPAPREDIHLQGGLCAGRVLVCSVDQESEEHTPMRGWAAPCPHLGHDTPVYELFPTAACWAGSFHAELLSALLKNYIY